MSLKIESKTESAGGIILNLKGDICLVNQQHYAWSLPKGHIEPGETVLETAKREIREETGLTNITLLNYLGHYSRFKMHRDGSDNTDELKTMYFFLYLTPETTLTPQDPDNPIAEWLPIHTAIQRLTHPKDQSFLESHAPMIMSYFNAQFLVMTTTAPTEKEAKTLAALAVENNYAACAQIEAPITSIYRWDTTIQCEQEYRITFKTHRLCVSRLETLIKANHSYDTPQLTCTALVHGSKDYLQWMIDALELTGV
jgi:periplasmic divalent cation tolerance protein